VTEGVITGPVAAFALALRRERLRVGLSVTELAKRAGLAKSTLSQLENGIGNPSLETIWSLAATLGVPFSRLVEDERPRIQVIRAGCGTPRISEHSNYTTTLLAACLPGARRDIYRITLQPGEPYQARAHAAGTVEHVVLAAGKALFGPAGKEIELCPGDYIAYPADVPHQYHALEPDTSAVLIIENT